VPEFSLYETNERALIFHCSMPHRASREARHLELGIAPSRARVDTSNMLWQVAALAVLLVGFVVVYGSVLQSRVDGTRDSTESG
jgi:hypothetical protein